MPDRSGMDPLPPGACPTSRSWTPWGAAGGPYSRHPRGPPEWGRGFHVLDLNSTNGTFLGGARIFEAEIPLNTALRVGETELLSTRRGPSPAPR